MKKAKTINEATKNMIADLEKELKFAKETEKITHLKRLLEYLYKKLSESEEDFSEEE